MTDSKPKSRLPRTGLLLLIAVVLVVVGGALSIWLTFHQQQLAIADIERLGGTTVSEVVRPGWISDAKAGGFSESESGCVILLNKLDKIGRYTDAFMYV